MEMTILQIIQSWHNPILDRIMVLVFNDFVGAKGELWLIIGLILFLIPKTRKCGICVIVSYTLAFFIGKRSIKRAYRKSQTMQRRYFFLSNCKTSIQLLLSLGSLNAGIYFCCCSIYELQENRHRSSRLRYFDWIQQNVFLCPLSIRCSLWRNTWIYHRLHCFQTYRQGNVYKRKISGSILRS